MHRAYLRTGHPASRSRRGRVVAASLALALGVTALTFAAQTPAFAEAEEYVEIHRFEPEAGRAAGTGSAVAGNYVAYTNRLSESISISHLRNPDTAEWETVTLAPEIASGGYGTAIALAPDATRAYVASPRTQEIDVYLRSGSNDWSLERKLAPGAMPDRVSSYQNSLGEGLALDGGQLVVGAPNANVDGQRSAGMAFVVDIETDTWTPLIPESPRPNSITGQSVAIRGDRVALGAVQVKADRRWVGGVYLWNTATGEEPLFTSQPETDPKVCLTDRGGNGPAFGISLAFDDTSLYVGSPEEISYSGETPDDPATGCTDQAVAAGATTQGAVHRFDDSLQPIGGKIMPPAFSYRFGGSISVSENALLASAEQGPEFAGEVHVIDTRELESSGTGDELTRQYVPPVQTLVASDPAPWAGFGNQIFGKGIATGGSRAVIGAPNARDDRGTVYLFEPIVPNVASPEITALDQTIEYSERGTITATVTGAAIAGTVSGTVAGHDLEPGVVTPSADVADETGTSATGTAELRTPAALLDADDYVVELHFTPETESAPTASTTATLTVTPLATKTTLRTIDGEGNTISSALAGDEVWFTGSVSDARETLATGGVTLWDGDTLLATASLEADGTFQLSGAESDFAVQADTTFEARYDGDINHLASRATTVVTLTTVTPPPPGTTSPPAPSTPAPSTDLARTGADTSTGWIIAAVATLLVLAGGGTAFAGWRRRTRAGSATDSGTAGIPAE